MAKLSSAADCFVTSWDLNSTVVYTAFIHCFSLLVPENYELSELCEVSLNRKKFGKIIITSSLHLKIIQGYILYTCSFGDNLMSSYEDILFSRV